MPMMCREPGCSKWTHGGWCAQHKADSTMEGTEVMSGTNERTDAGGQFIAMGPLGQGERVQARKRTRRKDTGGEVHTRERTNTPERTGGKVNTTERTTGNE